MGLCCGKLIKEENLFWAVSQTLLTNQAFIFLFAKLFLCCKVSKEGICLTVSFFKFFLFFFFLGIFSSKWTRRSFTWKFGQGQVLKWLNKTYLSSLIKSFGSSLLYDFMDPKFLGRTLGSHCTTGFVISMFQSCKHSECCRVIQYIDDLGANSN